MKYCPVCDQNYPNEDLEICEVDGATLRLKKEGKQDLSIGKIIKGRYRVIQKLGEGGMGAVYLAEQVAVSRKVALKWLHSDFAGDEEFIRRFRQEAKLAAALNHHNVVTIFDFDQADDGSLYIVMEYVDGKNLGEIVRNGPIEISRALRMAAQIAEGLTAAHRAGVIHRDVKPENIMVVGREEEIKLMDFGISRLRDTEGASRLTRLGTIIGTPAYMAPEQIEGGEVSEKTDIYAFGIVLYEMLSGAVPFRAPTPGAILIKHLQETAVPLRKIRREIPALVERIVTQALEKDAQRRQSSMQEMVDALKDAQRRAEITRTSATRSLTEPLARLGLSFGSAAARFKGIFGKPAAATPAKVGDETGQSHAVPSAAPVAPVLQSQTTLHSEETATVPQTALVTGTDLEDKPHPSLMTHLKGVLEKDASSGTSAVRQHETGQSGSMPAAQLEATVLQARTILQNEAPTLAPQSVPGNGPAVEDVFHPSVELADTAVLAKMEERHQINEELTLEEVVKIKPVPEPQAIPIATSMVATTVMASAGETMSEMTVLTPAPKGEEAGGFRWKWISGSAVAAALLGGVLYYRLQSEPPRQELAVVETKQPEVVVDTPKPPPSDVVEKAVPEAAPSNTLPEREPIKKSESPTKAKPQDVIKAPLKEKSSAIKSQEIAKTQETVGKSKEPAKSEPEKPAKEQQTEIASLKPTKPVEPSAAPAVSEPRLVSLSILPGNKELDLNTRITLTVKGKYSDGKENEIGASIHWESSDRNVAVVNSRGELEARKEGKAQITASYSGLTSPSYTFSVKGVPQAEKSQSSQENIKDLRRGLLR